MSDSNLVREKYIQFYAYWSSKFLSFSNKYMDLNQQLPGHKNVETTMIYTHVLRDVSKVPQSPLDAL